MSVYHSDPERESDSYSLPDVEVFYAEAGEWTLDENGECDDLDEDDEGVQENEAGWYYWYCFPGCLPEGDAQGPYATEEEAVQAMRDENEDF
jgi:hypothetical protein